MIIDIKYLAENVVNEELYELCTSSADKVQRYLNIVENKIKLYLDIEQFKENDEYIFPEELKEVVRFLFWFYVLTYQNAESHDQKIDASH